MLVLNAFEFEKECYILVGGNNQNIQVYSVRTGLLFAQLEGHTDSITCMLIDGNMLISGSDDCTILQWNLYLLFMRYEEEQKLRERMHKGNTTMADAEEEAKESKLGRVFLPAGTVGEHKEGVQDLLLLNNGLIVSIGQEKEILIWKN